MSPGDWVVWIHDKGFDVPQHADIGRVLALKSVSDQAWVVFRCDGEWHRYREFTGELCQKNDLFPVSNLGSWPSPCEVNE